MQYNVLRRLGAEVNEKASFPDDYLISHVGYADMIIDAMLGFNIDGNPRGIVADFIKLANESGRPILAVDIPSGLDGNTGKPFEPTIIANYTLTLALPKTGLMEKTAKKYVGKLFLADIGVPQVVYKKLGIDIPLLFEEEEIIKIS